MESTNRPPSPPDESNRSTADEQIRPTGSSQARSYECIFCKRGFSNAQALGGHMNIHRKDKAKLKQLAATASATSSDPNTEAQLSLNQSVDIPRSPSLFYSPNINLPSSQTHESLYSMPTKSIDNPDKGKFSTWPRFRRGDSPAGFDVDHHGGRELLAVFFEDQITESKEQEPDAPFPLPDDEEKGDDHPPIHGGDPGSAEIDLELRLGPERPQAGSSPSKGTKQFF